MRKVKDLFENYSGTIYFYITGSQGISPGQGFFHMSGDASEEDLCYQCASEIDDWVMNCGYNDYFEDGSSNEDDYEDYDDYLEADSDAFMEAIADCGEFHFSDQADCFDTVDYKYTYSNGDIEPYEEPDVRTPIEKACDEIKIERVKDIEEDGYIEINGKRIKI